MCVCGGGVEQGMGGQGSWDSLSCLHPTTWDSLPSLGTPENALQCDP